ncbi:MULTISPECIES: DUF2442 domain-containing protein [Methylococcus]|uniref:DUF2442 domain-containing protein n=1 Tax=Methylococcus TaxID=413 RepID=UPI0018E04004|nr:DUF2442 domain-containing protein [Methylococcus capsulatus]
MKYPRVKSVKAVESHALFVGFDNQQKRKYDVTPLPSKEMFSPLTNLALFRSVRVDEGGYAVVWNGNIDISEYELWRHGQPIP